MKLIIPLLFGIGIISILLSEPAYAVYNTNEKAIHDFINYPASGKDGWAGNTYFEEFTNLVLGHETYYVSLKILDFEPNSHIKVKIFNDISNNPINLLNQSNSILINSTGDIYLPVKVTIPDNGKLWIGVDIEKNSTKLKYSYDLHDDSMEYIKNNYNDLHQISPRQQSNESLWIGVYYGGCICVIDSAIPNSAPVGHSVFLNFNKFNSSGTAQIKFGSTLISNSTVNLNSTGGWQGTVLVPIGAGTTIQVNDGIDVLGTTFDPTLIDVAIPSYGYIGASTFLNFNYFINHTGTATIKFGSTLISNSTVNLNSTNGWSGTVMVPNGSGNTITVDSGSGDTITIPFTVFTPTLTLSPVNGTVGTVITASGSGFLPTQINASASHVHQNTEIGCNYLCIDWTGNIFAEKFTGIPANSEITSVGVGLYDVGTSSCIYPASGYPCHVIARVYDDSGGLPNALIGESEVNTVAIANAIENYSVLAQVPSNGIIWAAFETDSILYQPFWKSQFGLNTQIAAYSFGSGANPFGSAVETNANPLMAITYYTNNTSLSFDWDSTTLSTTPSSPTFDSSGSFSGITFNALNDTIGNHAIKAISYSGTFATSLWDLLPTAVLIVTPTSNYASYPVFISFNNMNGTGDATVAFGGTTISNSTVNKNSTGGWSGTVLVPAVLSGSRPLSISDCCGILSTPFTVLPPTIDSAIPTSGYIGDSVFLDVNEFTHSGTLGISFSGTTISNSTVSLNSTGGWEGTVLVPNGISANTGSVDFNDGFYSGSTTFNVLFHNIITSNFTFSGFVRGLNGYFNQPNVTLTSPNNANLTEIALYDDSSLVSDHIFSFPVHLSNGSNIIPINFTDTRGRQGTVNYTESASLQTPFNSTMITSNRISLYYGTFTPSQLNINQTNPLSVSFRFVRSELNSTTTNLDVFYPFTFNSTCDLAYQNELTNHTYHNLPASHAIFQFHGTSNDVINVHCLNANGNETGNYILTQSGFPLLKQVQDFRAGKFGTSGMFGAFDLVTLLVLIMSILGFNRINESVGVIVNVALIGALAVLGFIQWPVILSASIALVMVLVVSSTRKSQGF